MEKEKFIQLYLVEKGAGYWQSKPYPKLFYKLTGREPKPRVFEPPWTIFTMQFLYGSVIWSMVIGFLVWQQDFDWLFISLFLFNIVSGIEKAYMQRRMQAKLGITDWQCWLEVKGFA